MYVYTRFDIEIKVYKGKSNSKRVLFIKKSQQATNHKTPKNKHQEKQQNIHLKIHCEAETQQQQQQQLKLKSANCCKKRIQRLHPNTTTTTESPEF